MLPNDPKNISTLFNPKSIAVYGVSSDTGKIGFTIFSNLIAAEGFKGQVYPVNPKYDEIYGFKCYSKVADIPEEVDMAIMAIPSQFAIQVIEDCAKKKVKNLVVISAGFKETGHEGAKLEEEMLAKANQYGISILGPNCLGVITSANRMNASFAAVNPDPGDIAFASQSGAVCTALLDMANISDLGFSHFVSLGNKVSINENDLLANWLTSDLVKAIGFYLEEFSSGIEFVTMKQKLRQEKPIVVINPGSSDAARSAMSSHTGSLAGSVEVISAALEKYGINKVDSITDSYNLLMAYSWLTMPKGDRVGIITNAGGPGIIATDFVSDSGLKVAELTAETKQKLQQALPPNASIANPIDIVGDAMVDRYRHALTVMNEAPEIDAVVMILTPQLVTQIEETVKFLINISKNAKKTIIPIFIGGKYVLPAIERLYDNKIAVFSELDAGIRTLAEMVKYQKYLENNSAVSFSAKSGRKVDLQNYMPEDSRIQAIPETLVTEILSEFEIKTPRSGAFNDENQAAEFMRSFGGNPVVIKASTEDIVHKTDFQAIYVNLTDENDFRGKFWQLRENIKEKTGRDNPMVLVQEQVVAKEELFVGLKRDGSMNVYKSVLEGEDSFREKGFGHLLLFGKGGIYTEVFADIAKRLVPLSDLEISSLIEETKVSKIINGARGQNPLAKSRLVDTLKKLAQLVMTYPEIAEMDINPIMINENECFVVDAKIFVGR